MLGFLQRNLRRLHFECAKRLGWDAYTKLRIARENGLARLGNPLGGWIIPTRCFNRDSVCYCVGVGEEISFDLALLETYQCPVFAFDPTPRAIKYIENAGLDPQRYRFLPVGIWDRDERVRFYAPQNPAHVSHSALNLQQTEQYFEAPCRTLQSLMCEFGHSAIDLLKLDIEGAEYKVLDSILRDRLPIRVLCVEFDEIFHPLDADYPGRVREALLKLEACGFALVAVGSPGNYTLLNRKFAAQR